MFRTTRIATPVARNVATRGFASESNSSSGGSMKYILAAGVAALGAAYYFYPNTTANAVNDAKDKATAAGHKVAETAHNVASEVNKKVATDSTHASLEDRAKAAGTAVKEKGKEAVSAVKKEANK
eukprot:TRINITY_DN4445_c0_g1_i1.p1 TRINITY_DN4445_c0_g1~~TRINITY_DN4445_c0_g1_i1.p1  ORF type:complete len:125 (-),score=32.17 TRINITY_DN4445_c0_g1_i1:59-433(-)